MKRALIFGVGGQDGSYLAELLLSKGYEVHGTVRRSSYDNIARVAHVRDRLTLHRCELTDAGSIHAAIYHSRADEIYNMADQDEVGWSKDTPGYSVGVTYGGPAVILEFLRHSSWANHAKFFQPISSTVFGPTAAPQDESTPLNPGSPYACAKAAAWLLCKHYRREHGVFVSCGVFFNHDSPRRGPGYLLQQIARQAVAVARGERNRVELTGPDSYVDVGWAPDYVDAAWRTLQQDAPDDYVIGTECALKVSEHCRTALMHLGLNGYRYELADVTVPSKWSRSKPRLAYHRLDWTPSCVGGNVVTRLVNHLKGGT